MSVSAQTTSSRPVPVAHTAIDWLAQEEFIRFSGDRNPMHTDAVAARRTPPGQIVVYGMHMLLWALESLSAGGHIDASLVRIRLKFLKWIYLDDAVSLFFLKGSGGSPDRLEIRAGSMLAIAADLFTGSPAERPPRAQVGTVSPKRLAARPLTLEEIEGTTGRVPAADLAQSVALYPSLAAVFGPHLAAEIAGCSYIVGMEAPGLYSIDSKAEWEVHARGAAPAQAATLAFEVVSVDARFRRARIHVEGEALTGTLEAFVRNPPVQQAAMRQVAQAVVPHEFAGMHALVVGGSRGLGEAAAKCIAAGGGRCTFTWATGEQDAEAVAQEMREAAPDTAVAHYDVRQPAAPQLARLTGPFTHVLYFATGPMFRPKGALVSAPHLAEFTQFYLQGFHDLCTELVQQQGGSPLVVYYPSSLLVEERGAGYTEFAAIKAAGEQMCRDLQRALPGLRIVTARLPKLLTDQTAPVVPERFPDTVEVFLPVLRQMRSAAS